MLRPLLLLTARSHHAPPVQADTPDSVRPSANVVPGTTERLLAGFTLNTPIAGLKLQVRGCCGWLLWHKKGAHNACRQVVNTSRLHTGGAIAHAFAADAGGAGNGLFIIHTQFQTPLQTPPWARNGGTARHPPEAQGDQENGLPWIEHSQQPSCSQPQQQHAQEELPQAAAAAASAAAAAAGPVQQRLLEVPVVQHQQQQRQAQLSFRLQPTAPSSAGRHRLAQQGPQQDHSWFGATAHNHQQPYQPQQQQQQRGQRQQQPHQHQQLSQPTLSQQHHYHPQQPQQQPEPFCSGSQQSLSLAHFFQGSQQHHSDGGLTVGSLGDGVGLKPFAEEVEQPPVSPPPEAGEDYSWGLEPVMGPSSQALAALRAGGSPRAGDEMCTPVTGWEAARAESPEVWKPHPSQQQQQQQEEQEELSQPQVSYHPSQSHGQQQRHYLASQHAQDQHAWSQQPPDPSPCGSSPALWRAHEGLAGDSGSRAGANCTPLSEEDFVLKASQSYTRAMAVKSPALPGAPRLPESGGGPAMGGGGGAGVEGEGAAQVGAAKPHDDYHTPLHPGSQVRAGCWGWSLGHHSSVYCTTFTLQSHRSCSSASVPHPPPTPHPLGPALQQQPPRRRHAPERRPARPVL